MAESVTVLHPGTRTDGYGDDQPSWEPDDITQEDVATRGVEPMSSTEDNDGRQAVITGFRVYLEQGAQVGADDRIVLRGTEYDVDGRPADWRSPWGGVTGGIVVALKVGEG